MNKKALVFRLTPPLGTVRGCKGEPGKRKKKKVAGCRSPFGRFGRFGWFRDVAVQLYFTRAAMK
jgi:hypothetical protein